MTTKIKWLVCNLGLLGLFLYGTIYNVDGFATLAIIGYWALSIMSFLLFIPDVQKGATKKIIETGQKVSPRWLNLIFDTGVTIMLAWYGYPILAFFWVVHMFAYMSFYNALKEAAK